MSTTAVATSVAAADIFADEHEPVLAVAASSLDAAAAAVDVVVDDDDDDDDAPAASVPAKKRKRTSGPARTVGARLIAERERGIAAETARVAAVQRRVTEFEHARSVCAKSAADLLVARLDRRMLTAVLTAATATGQAYTPVLSIDVSDQGAELTMFEHSIVRWYSSQAENTKSVLRAAVYEYMTNVETRDAVKVALCALAPGVKFRTHFVGVASDDVASRSATAAYGIWTCHACLPGHDDDDDVDDYDDRFIDEDVD